MEAQKFLPRNKHDFEKLNVLIAAGPDAAIPILGELLTWLQDINWPIAIPLADFLVTVGEPLLPHLKKVLLSHDDMWVYWVLQAVVAKLPKDLVRHLEPELRSLATVAENDHIALRVGGAAGIWDNTALRRMLANKISAYEEFLLELKAMEAGLPEP